MHHCKDGHIGAGIIPDKEQHHLIDISYCYFLSVLRKKEEGFNYDIDITHKVLQEYNSNISNSIFLKAIQKKMHVSVIIVVNDTRNANQV